MIETSVFSSNKSIIPFVEDFVHDLHRQQQVLARFLLYPLLKALQINHLLSALFAFPLQPCTIIREYFSTYSRLEHSVDEVATKYSKFKGCASSIIRNFLVNFFVNLANSISVSLLKGGKLLVLQVEALIKSFYLLDLVLPFLEVFSTHLHLPQNFNVQLFNLFV